MSTEKAKIPHTVISWFFLLYFVILFGERLQSLIRSAASGVFFCDAFEGTAGVILVSGMIHTLYTVPGIQFASYGMLIVAMILRVIQLLPNVKCPFGTWYSLLYLTVFSMAIPVVYKFYSLPNPALFHVIEYIVMLALVISFTLMLRRLFLGKGENLLLWIPFAIMAVGDAVILWMSWSVSVNTFVLIFAALSVVLFIAGTVIFILRKHS